jgi:hypothetical protein
MSNPDTTYEPASSYLEDDMDFVCYREQEQLNREEE